ncbi:TIGR03826 family flagellar region protein [Bacillus sp. T33-2]|uniref:TIGR03826 family flagellar region protein n=1 Tax=Bacillus sp. T33-2 TaxID=2054168 RepID=UPI000C7915E8|nr:TIGR03826 family flagellar region protein [Bacillus sp. T33-2]PLR90806.1 hypothetical protein CVD19_22510 [Bacillus sp. T33-2]
MELINCSSCGDIHVKNKFRDVCPKCWKEEETAYETVYQYMRKRENRAATILQAVEATGVTEELILKFIRTGRLKLTQFPNFGYPCEKCGRIIRDKKLCPECINELTADLKAHEQNEELKREIAKRDRAATYYTRD